ncbi:MAG: transcriptional regulator TetR family [Bacillota bacterium]|jgi:AcrR family transcriptional regulator|nr:transcriptional regulator TetR family [Bacillota bacterium]
MLDNIKHTILTKSIELFINKGFDNVSINEICSSCNITKRTFYYHYDSKNTLLLDYFTLANETIDATLDQIEEEKTWLDKCWKIKEIYISSFVKLNADILKNLIKIDMEQNNLMFDFHLNDFNSNVKRMRQLVIEYTRRGQKAGEISTAHTAEELSHCFSSAFLGLAINWCSTGGNYDLASQAKRYYDIIYRG